MAILQRGSNELEVQMNGGSVVLILSGGLVVNVGKLNGGRVVVVYVGLCDVDGIYVVVVSGENFPITEI